MYAEIQVLLVSGAFFSFYVLCAVPTRKKPNSFPTNTMMFPVILNNLNVSRTKGSLFKPYIK